VESHGEAILGGLDKSSGGREAKRYRYNLTYMLGLAIFLEKKKLSIHFLTVWVK